MKRLQYSLYSLFIIGFLASCGSDKKSTVIESDDGKVKIENLKNAGEQMEMAVNDAEKRREERKKRGDTLAMNYKELQKYLPDINGYTKSGNPGGESMTMPGMGSFSQADQSYESGDKSIEITLLDYNQSMLGFTAASAMFSMNIQVENDQEKSGSFETGINGVRGYETISKTDQRAEVMYAIADRYMLTLKLNGSNDADVLKKIAKGMKLDELASK